MSHTLIVLPDDSAKPLVDAINGAKRTLQIRMFLFTDPTMLQTVLAAKKRGVDRPRDAQSRAARRHERQRRDAQGARRREDRGPRQQSRVRPHAPEVDGDRREDGLRRIAQLGNARSDRDARLRRRDDARPRSPGNDRVLRGGLGTARSSRRTASRSSSGARTTAASASPTSSNRRSTRCGCRTSATRTRSSSSAWCGRRGAACKSTSSRGRRTRSRRTS